MRTIYRPIETDTQTICGTNIMVKKRINITPMSIHGDNVFSILSFPPYVTHIYRELQKSPQKPHPLPSTASAGFSKQKNNDVVS